ncbi:MAG TPA: SpoIIE family protein phosphatase, partial [Candidatus Eisenbacteria bacterium]
LELARAGAEETLPAVVRRCHAGLHVTRGVALSLAHIDAAAGTVTWIGVGNVTCLIARPDGSRAAPVHNLLPARGVVGRRLPPLAARTVPVAAGEVLILSTDGVDAHFQFNLPGLDPLQGAADDILRRFSTGDDDALVVMLRYRGVAA